MLVLRNYEEGGEAVAGALCHLKPVLREDATIGKALKN